MTTTKTIIIGTAISDMKTNTTIMLTKTNRETETMEVGDLQPRVTTSLTIKVEEMMMIGS